MVEEAQGKQIQEISARNALGGCMSGIGGLRAGTGVNVTCDAPRAVREAPVERKGSLGEAFEELNNELDLLESAGKRLYERASPILEPAQTAETVAKEPGRGVVSAYAESVFEYAARVRRVRVGLHDISDRIAF